MSLKTRLRISVLIFLLAVVVGFSMLHVYSLAKEKFDHALDNATLTSQLAKTAVKQRVTRRFVESNATPQSIGDYKRLWQEIAKDDPILGADLIDSFSGSRTVVGVLVSGEDGMVLNGTNPTLIGKPAPKLAEFTQWIKQGMFTKVWDLSRAKQDYAVTLPLGEVGSSEPVLVVQVLVSAVLLRDQILPDLINLAIITTLALLISVLLAYLVSNWAVQPLQAIMTQIDFLANNQDATLSDIPSDTKELMAVQSKLDLLGQRVRGAQVESAALRTNIEQMVERLEEAVLLFDRNGLLILCGQPAARIFGSPIDELLGKPMEEIFLPDTPAGDALRRSGAKRQSLRNYNFVLDQPEGRPLRMLMNAETLESFPDLESLGTLITLRDIDSRREVESQLGVSSRLEAINKLLSGVAHEIKNPLNAMALHLEILKDAVREERALPSLNIIGREIFRLDRVVKTFLDFTRPVEMRMREVDLHAVLIEIGSLVRPDAEAKRITVELPPPGTPVLILADPDLLKQALLNVVVNGVEAMPAGGTLEIALDRPTPGETIVTITDSGPGIPPELRDKIFNLYFTTKQGGSGLGLALTFRAMQLHNGTIDFQSKPGKGTTFLLKFPALVTPSYRSERTSVVYSS